MVINLAAELRAIDAALADRLTIVREIIDVNRNVIATYRRTVAAQQQRIALCTLALGAPERRRSNEWTARPRRVSRVNVAPATTRTPRCSGAPRNNNEL